MTFCPTQKIKIIKTHGGSILTLGVDLVTISPWQNITSPKRFGRIGTFKYLPSLHENNIRGWGGGLI